jgi:hypothetical protein
MIKYAVFLFTITSIFFNVEAQITIVKDDVAAANDTIRISRPANLDDFDYLVTDTNFLWNFSTLEINSQTIKEYYTVFETGTIYGVYFNDLPFNPNRANMAGDADLSLPALITSSDSYSFYDRNNNEFKQVGIGSTLNGIQTPFRFQDDDEIYKFPLNYGNIDTSTAKYNIDIPNLVTYTYNHTRINEVDGWGKIILPIDTFEVIRMKSTLRIRDSIYIDSLNFGFGFNRPIETQYIWLAKERKIPVLQINTRRVGGNNVFVSSSFYQDKEPPNAIFEKIKREEILVFPNPVKNSFVVKSGNIQWQKISLIDNSGKIYSLTVEEISAEKIKIDISKYKLSSGWYILSLENANSVSQKLIMILP